MRMPPVYTIRSIRPTGGRSKPLPADTASQFSLRSCPRKRGSSTFSWFSGSPLSRGRAVERFSESPRVLERRERRLRHLDVLLDLGAAGGDRPDHLAADLDREAA